MSDSASAFFDSYFRAGWVQGMFTLYGMVAESLPRDVRERLEVWRESCINAAHGIDVPGWTPPESLTHPVAIPDSRLPQPIVRFREAARLHNDPLGLRYAAMQGAPLPPKKPATDQRVARGRTVEQILRERAHAEDSERP